VLGDVRATNRLNKNNFSVKCYGSVETAGTFRTVGPVGLVRSVETVGTDGTVWPVGIVGPAGPVGSVRTVGTFGPARTAWTVVGSKNSRTQYRFP